MVTIIVTTYNRELYLEKCLKSILSQSYKDISILVISDGYFKDTELLVKSFNDNRIKLLSNKHTGLPAVSRNIGICLATTKYLCFCDDDDIWYPDKLKSQFEIIQNNNVDIVFTDIQYININDLIIQNKLNSLLRLYNNFLSTNVHGHFIKNNICLSSAMIKSELAKENLFNESEIFRGTEDYIFWLELIIKRKKISYLKQKLVGYRIHENNLSSNRLDAYSRSIHSLKYLLEKYSKKKFIILVSIFIYKIKKSIY